MEHQMNLHQNPGNAVLGYHFHCDEPSQMYTGHLEAEEFWDVFFHP